MMSRLCFVLMTAGALAAVSPAEAAVEIYLGSTVLLPDTPDQMLNVTISGDEPIWGVDFFIRMEGDGAAVLPSFQITPQGSVGPLIDGVLAEGAGYVFDGVLTFLDTVMSSPTSANIALLTFDDSGVDPNGILLTLLVDTTGVHEGRFVLEPMIEFDVTNAMGESLAPTIHPGEILIAPEPGVASVALMVGGLLAMRQRRC